MWLQFRRVVRELEAEFLRLHHNVAAAGEIADEHGARVADERRVNVLVARSEFLHGVDVHAALVRKRRRADPRQARVVTHVRDLIHELRKFLQLAAATSRGTQVFFIFNATQRNDAGQIAIAGALAVAVDGALHVHRAGFERGQGVRHAKADVVMRVNADRAIQFAQGELS